MAENNLEQNITKIDNQKPQKPEVKIIERKKGGRFLSSLALLISLGALAISGYLYYINTEYQNSLANQLALATDKMATNNSLINTKFLNLTNSLLHVESQVNSMVVSSNKKNILLLQLNELVGLANQSLIVYNDVKSTEKLLNYALQLLENNTDAQYIDIKSAINTDINNLMQLPYIDSIVLIGRLNSLATQLNTLPLIDYDKKVRINYTDDVNLSSNGDATATLWNKFWNNFKRDIKSIVIVSNINNAKEIQLLPDKEIIIRQNIKLYLLNAKMALLQHDDNAWKFNLDNIKTELSTYFSQSTITDAILSNLDELIKINISTANLDINATLKALNKLDNLQ